MYTLELAFTLSHYFLLKQGWTIVALFTTIIRVSHCWMASQRIISFANDKWSPALLHPNLWSLGSSHSYISASENIRKY